MPRPTTSLPRHRRPRSQLPGVGCHPGTNLLPIHSALACAQCHESSDTTVTDAIAAGDKRCATCHPTGGAHAASHDGGLVRPDCLECHKSNIAEEHENNCDKCHESTDPAVVAAISAGNVTCGSCHIPAITRLASSAARPTTTSGPRLRGHRDSGPAWAPWAPTPRTRACTQLPGQHRQVRHLPLRPPCGGCGHQAASDGQHDVRRLPHRRHGHHGQAHHVDAVRRQLGSGGRSGRPALSRSAGPRGWPRPTRSE